MQNINNWSPLEVALHNARLWVSQSERENGNHELADLIENKNADDYWRVQISVFMQMPIEHDPEFAVEWELARREEAEAADRLGQMRLIRSR